VPFHSTLEFYGDYSILTTDATMSQINFDPVDPGLGLPHPDSDFSLVNQFSNIKVRRDNVTVGFRADLDMGLILNLGYGWTRYQDIDPLLFPLSRDYDETGKYQVLFGSVGYRF
jgi:hypothetical protein